MSREYDASRRQQAAQRTREAILAAAFNLHGQGILDLESLARDADVSVATVRKHFPNREQLFQGCTAYGFHRVAVPDPAALAAIADPAQRLTQTVIQVYALHEALFGQEWSAYKLVDESPVMAATVDELEGLVTALVDIANAGWNGSDEACAATRGLVSGFLSPLTYRAFRIHGQLSPEQATRQATAMLLQALQAGAVPAREEAVHL
ncbi:MAG: TetR/AcrR family transcriptional regulator [Tepidiformaceae bacterium]